MQGMCVRVCLLFACMLPLVSCFQSVNPKERDYPGYKMAPYTVKGQRIVPMTVDQALHYQAVGICSHYDETSFFGLCSGKTALGEDVKSYHEHAAHRTLPLPCKIRVTSCRTGRSIVLRVNDRGPFVKGRLLDISSAAAKKLGFRERGLDKVYVEVLSVGDGKWERRRG